MKKEISRGLRNLPVSTLLLALLFAWTPSGHAVEFQPVTNLTSVPFVTVLTIGPEDPDPTSVRDACLYIVGGMQRAVHRVCIDANKDLILQDIVIDLPQAGFVDVATGIVFDPNSDPDGEMILYLAYPDPITGPFNGKIARAVSTDGGNTYSVDPFFITGLPRSQVLHQTEDMRFGPDGCLYIGQGNNSDTGYNPDHAESRLSGSIVRACFNDPQGNVKPDYDRNCGDNNTQEACDLEIYASGMRNPFDLVFHSNGRLYATDNDTDPGFFGECVSSSPANDFGCPCQTSVQPIGDELNLVQQGRYYGSPNPYLANPSGLQCNGGTDGGDACQTDADCGGGGECVDLSGLCTDHRFCGEPVHCFYFGFQDDPQPGEDPKNRYERPIVQPGTFLDGISEYVAEFDERVPGCFLSDWNGDLLTAGSPGPLSRFTLSANGKEATFEGGANLNGAFGLDVVVGHDGTIYTTTLFSGQVNYIEPIAQPNIFLPNYFEYCEDCKEVDCRFGNDDVPPSS